MEEDFPPIDVPKKPEEGEPVDLPFGEELGIDGDENALFGGNSTTPADGLHPGVIAAIVVVIILLVGVIAGVAFYVVKRKQVATSA
jgi:hypothetical protein